MKVKLFFFKLLFFNHSVVDDSVIENFAQRELLHDMSLKPTLEEVEQSIKQINTGRAPRLDGIPAELLHYGGGNVALGALELINQFWDGPPIPQDWIDGILVSIFKGEGSKSVCDSYRGITLLEVVRKVLARLLLNRLMMKICPPVIPETQSGFRVGRGTMDMIFSGTELQEKCIKQRVPLYQVFVDLTNIG